MTDFNFDLAEPLETSTTHHQRNFSQSLLSNIKFEPRTAEQREEDARRNGPKYAREKAVNSMLTARFLKAKKTFDTYWGYSIDAAWDAEGGVWQEERDPWLRIGTAAGEKGEGPVGEFLRGYTRRRVEAQREGEAVEKDGLTGEELEGLAVAVVRVAKVDLEAAGRESKGLDEEYKKRVLEVVAQLKREYGLPEKAPEQDDEEEEEVNGVDGA